MAVFLKKSIFLIIRLLGGFGMVQNTPTGCGNDLPILLRNLTFDRKCVLLYHIIYDFRSDNGNSNLGFCDLEFTWDPIRSLATWNSPWIPIRTFATWNSNSRSRNLLQASNLLNACLKYLTPPTSCIQIRTFATWNSNSGSRHGVGG